MRFGAVLKLATVAAFGAAVALVAVVKSIDLQAYRGSLAEMVKAATGRDLALRGGLELKLGLPPVLVATDLALMAPQGSARPELLTVRKAEAELDLLPLLARRFEVRRLTISQPDLLIDIQALPWPLTGSVEAAGPAAAAVPTLWLLNEVRIAKGVLTIRQADGTATPVAVASASLRPGPGGRSATVDAAADWQDRRWTLTGVFGDADAKIQSRGLPFKLKADAGGLVVVADGALTEPWRLAGLDLKLALEATDAAEAARLAGFDLPLGGPLRLSGHLLEGEGGYALSDIDAAAGRRDFALIGAKGGIRQPFAGQGLDLLMSIESENPAALAAALGLQAGTVGNLKASARLSDSEPGWWRLTDLKSSLGKSDLGGEIRLRRGGTRPAIQARLASALLDVEDLTPPPVRTGEPAVAAPAPTERRLIPETPLPLEALRAADLDVEWRGERLRLGSEATEVHLKMMVENGRALLRPVSARLGGGQVIAEAALDGSTLPAKASLAIEAEQVELGGVLSGLGFSRGLQGARTNLSLALRGTGTNWRGLISRLSGSLAVIVEPALVTTEYTDLLAFGLLRDIAPWAATPPITRMNCLVGLFDVARGIVRSELLVLETERMTATGRGTLSLENEALALTITPTAKELAQAEAAVPMDVGGTLGHPTIFPIRAAGQQAQLAAASSRAAAGNAAGNACVDAMTRIKKGAVAPARRQGQQEQP